MCKGGDTFSLAVLIDRGLDLRPANQVSKSLFGYAMMLSLKMQISSFRFVSLLLCSVLRVLDRTRTCTISSVGRAPDS